MTARSRLLLLIPHLGGGGAERVIANLAHGLSRESFDIHLGILGANGPGAPPLPPDVTAYRFGTGRVRASALAVVSLVRRLRPDLILCGIYHLNFLVLFLRPLFPRGTRIVVRQNGSVASTLAASSCPSFARLLYRLLYPWASRVLCQSQEMAAELASEAGVPLSSIAVLPNPVDFDAIRNAGPAAPPVWRGPGPHLLAMGRLSDEKGFDILLEAFVQVHREFPSASLLIAGTGAEMDRLRALPAKLSLGDSVRFAGAVNEPWGLFPGATLFVLPSRQDALPNALLEAAAAGLPIVATPASKGLADLLRGQPGVWLAPEVSAQALAASLLACLRLVEPGDRFPHPFVKPFRLGRSLAAYERLLLSVLAEEER
ncbi:MAG: glycosyltransferase [Terracidiphilus sp.]